MSIIDVTGLSKEYKTLKKKKGLKGSLANLFHPEYERIKAVKNVSFSIEQGEMVGFIGPNGAGKSTTIKILSGILYPTSGTVLVNGFIPYSQRKRYVGSIGVVFGQRSQLWYDLPVEDTFQLLKYIYRIPHDQFVRNVAIFNELLGIHEFAAKPVRQLSLGQRMRAEFASAMLHSPEIVFFDEPTIGLDVLAKQRVREFISYVNKEYGTTMLFTTHDMQDIEKTCPRIIVIDKGEKIWDGSVNAIKDRFGSERFLVAEFAEEYSSIEVEGAIVSDLGNGKKKLSFGAKQSSGEIITRLTSRYSVSDISIKEPEIEEIIRDIYQGKIVV